MHNRLRIRSIWRIRGETLEEITQRVNDTFRRTGELSPSWNNWWRGYKSIPDRNRGPLYLTDKLDLIQQELLDRRVKNPDGTFFEEFCYSISTSAGEPKGSGLANSHFMCTVCTTSPYSGSNVASIELPVKSFAPQLYDTDFLCRVINVMADVWDPDSAVVWHPGTELVPRPYELGPSLGWINYLPARVGVVEGDLPMRWRWYEGRGDKQIFVHEGGPPDKANSNHVYAFEQMAERIRWNTDLQRGHNIP